ncbi:hypothetical protein [Actinomadura sp. 6N118]|uniref:hypothetical protein n=1 Tax=Actinomadura sp. 6N118 TaxID=3375151 RepID=UPI003788C08F
MTINISAAADFMAGHSRVLDRRCFQLLLGETDTAGVLAAVDGYRNPDGGYGWGLEPDLRSPESQPGAALHAFGVFQAIAPATAPQAVALCDWMQSVSLPDGGVPFALPLTTTAATAPWWQGADPTVSSLQITSVSAAAAHRVAAHDPAVAAHPWLARATRYCLDQIAALNEAPHAYILSFSILFLDAVHDTYPEAAELLTRLGKYIPDDGKLYVEGGTEDEYLHPLDFSPYPNSASRALFTPEQISADLDRLAALQQDDGGWTVEYAKISPAGSLEWRGAVTVNAIDVLQRNGRI